MTTKLKLSPQREKWVGKRTTTLHGKPLNYNAMIQLRYVSKLRKLVRGMTSTVKESIIKLFKTPSAKSYFKEMVKASKGEDNVDFAVLTKRLMAQSIDKFEKLFNDHAKVLADDMFEETKTVSEVNLKSSFEQLSGGLTLKTSPVPKSFEPAAKAIIEENVSLITTIPARYLAKVEQEVMRSITTGNGITDLIQAIEKYGQQEYTRAKWMALDQTRKTYSHINKSRMQMAGVTRYIWRHSGGGQFPRKDHIEMSGNTYSFDNPPIIDRKTGERGIPGDAINCRCRMEPIIEFEDGEEI